MLNQSASNLNRRKFFSNALKNFAGLGVVATAMGISTHQSYAKSTLKLRPPGAADEQQFLASCVRCGLCTIACPFDTLKLSKLGDGGTTGTPYFEAREIPCEMCPDLPCIAACPTGALDPAVDNIDAARMGTAVLISSTTCLSIQGLRCDVCYRVCPLLDEAITLEVHRNARTGVHAVFVPTVNAEKCTGCGKCEYACVLDTAAIKVLPTELAYGTQDQHYRLGWKEKQKAGSSLVPTSKPALIRRPEQRGG